MVHVYKGLKRHNVTVQKPTETIYVWVLNYSEAKNMTFLIHHQT